MFINYYYQYLSYNEETKNHHYDLTIFDDVFESEIVENITTFPYGSRVPTGTAADALHAAIVVVGTIISLYSSKNLDVSFNLFLFFKLLEEKYDYVVLDNKYFIN